MCLIDKNEFQMSFQNISRYPLRMDKTLAPRINLYSPAEFSIIA